MRTHSFRWVFVLCAAVPMGVGMADDTFRCGSGLVELEMSKTEVLAMCGEPTSKAVQVEDVHSGPRVVGTTTTERWTYESYSATRVLVFDQDTLKSIE